MKQILQNLKTGDTTLMDIPKPQLKSGYVLIRTRKSLISAGTERMLLEFGKGNLLQKAQQQPEKVKEVFDKIKTDGLMATLSAVQNKLDQPLTLGYCNVGEVIEIDEGVNGIHVGQRVLSNGAHAELVTVPKNLCVPIPETVSDDQAVFGVLAAVALQGIRLANPTLGENFCVIGLGLIGLLTVQLLRAQGCRVLGIDFDENKLQLAKQFGAEIVDLLNDEDPLTIAQHFSKQRGVDGVLITAATQSNDPVHQAAQMCRKRGRIILVGIAGLELSRADFYEKELSFQVSCSYGPGRYDPDYEQAGHDYPIGFVRWTEQRNFEAVLDMLAERKVDFAPLISHRISFEYAEKAYELLASENFSLGILLEYKSAPQNFPRTVTLNHLPFSEAPCVGFIGAGNYANQILIPAFKKMAVNFKMIASQNGVSGAYIGKKYGFSETTTDVEILFADPQINTIVIASRHNNHAAFVCEAIKAGKHVYVEKPLCINVSELERIEKTLSNHAARVLMVGFNRRFSALTQIIKSLLVTVKQPKVFIMTINAGAIPEDHWTQNRRVGGGRIIGELCHFVDLLRFLTAASIQSFQVTQLGQDNVFSRDNVTITLQFADGSYGVIHYLANGHRRVSKERLEIFCEGRILQLDNFRELKGYGWPTFKKQKLWRQDKGQKACVAAFVNAIKNASPDPIPLQEILEVSRVMLEIDNALSV